MSNIGGGETRGQREGGKDFFFLFTFTTKHLTSFQPGRPSASSVIVLRGNFDVPNQRRKRGRYRQEQLKILVSCRTGERAAGKPPKPFVASQPVWKSVLVLPLPPFAEHVPLRLRHPAPEARYRTGHVLGDRLRKASTTTCQRRVVGKLPPRHLSPALSSKQRAKHQINRPRQARAACNPLREGQTKSRNYYPSRCPERIRPRAGCTSPLTCTGDVRRLSDLFMILSTTGIGHATGIPTE
ncbi:hypothetical protein VTN02DRAFT_1807 [Thermoascus thermophilus]